MGVAGGRKEERLRGLRPVAGVETDAGGERLRVAYGGERTLAEGLVVTSRTARPPRQGRTGRGDSASVRIRRIPAAIE